MGRFNPSLHPRDKNGKFKSKGGKGRRSRVSNSKSNGYYAAALGNVARAAIYANAAKKSGGGTFGVLAAVSSYAAFKNVQAGRKAVKSKR